MNNLFYCIVCSYVSSVAEIDRKNVIDFLLMKALKGKSLRDTIISYYQANYDVTKGYGSGLASDYIEFIKRDRNEKKEESAFTDELVKSILADSEIKKESKETWQDEFMIILVPFVSILLFAVILAFIYS